MTIKVCVAGVSGWVGRCLAPAIWDSDDLQLVAVVARTPAGRRLGELLGRADIDIKIQPTVHEALASKTDVLVDFTRPNVVRDHVLQAINEGVHAVIGTSGLSDADYERIDAAATAKGVGVLAAGNFAITAVLMQAFSAIAARHVRSWEIVDYTHADKPDAPSGTVRELAYRLSKVGPPQTEIPVDQTQGLPEARGATLNSSQVHSVRLPGFVNSAEAIFGMPDERLTLRHDAGAGAQPYVGGTLLAVRKVRQFKGLKRGLDSILDLS